MPFVSRAGEKLEHALTTFKVDVTHKTCADFGSSTGGFVDCLLQHGATKVYAVETGYGTIDWKLRNDPRVVVMERTNAMHVELPEKMDVITIDTSWTKLEKIVPNALLNLKQDGFIIALLKPHYEAEKNRLRGGVVSEEDALRIVDRVKEELRSLHVDVVQITQSPIVGKKGGNIEFLFLIRRMKEEKEGRHPPQG